ncbi:MAG: hypothetical protein K2N38_01630 [Oscillospiraceae bacterium]|nr:hypothetical protein [Oscillospiraceae bacterium]
MENTIKKPMALWRKLILLIPLGVIALCWLFYYVSSYCGHFHIEEVYGRFGGMFKVCGWALMTGSAALILALIPIIFIRPLSGGTGIKVLRVAARCLLFLASAAVISFQCFFGVIFLWGWVD